MQGIPAKSAMVASAAVAAGAGSYVIYQNRQSISLALWRWQLKRCVDGTACQIKVVNNLSSWNAIEKELLRSSYALGCVGFDCEWVSGSGARRPVALLQLATYSGLCVLIRLCHITSPPQKLLEMLRDPGLLKVGVAPAEDCRLLQIDHGIVVNGAVDLRVFLSSIPSETKQTKKTKKKQIKTKSETEINSKVNAENCPPENETCKNANMPSVASIRKDTTDVGSRGQVAAKVENSSENSLITSFSSPLQDSALLNNVTPSHTNSSAFQLCSSLKTPNKLSADASAPSLLSSAPVSSCDSPVSKASSSSSKETSAEAPSLAVQGAGHKVPFVGLKGPPKLGLSGLAQFYLKRTLDKDWRVRASDWEVEHLTQRQISYAAEDARSGLHVFLVIIQTIVVAHNLFQLCSVGFFTSVCSWSSTTRSLIFSVAGHLAFSCPPERNCDSYTAHNLANWAKLLQSGKSCDLSID